MPELTEAESLRRALVAEKHDQAKTLLREQGIDCWLTFQREGSDCLLPVVLGVDELVSQSALMLFADGPSVAIVMDYDATVVEGIFDEVTAYSSTWRDPLLQTLRERDPDRIAINYDMHDDGIDGLTRAAPAANGCRQAARYRRSVHLRIAGDKPGAADQVKQNAHYVIPNPTEQKGKWKEVFQNDQPIHIEVYLYKSKKIIYYDCYGASSRRGSSLDRERK